MFVLLGSNGQITSQLARLVLAARHRVRVLGRGASHLAPLAQAGAEVAHGEPADAEFLTRAFAGATAIYTMIPPCYDEHDMRGAQDRIGKAIASALRKVRGARVVNLSSIGAELPQGTGPIEALHAQNAKTSTRPSNGGYMGGGTHDIYGGKGTAMTPEDLQRMETRRARFEQMEALLREMQLNDSQAYVEAEKLLSEEQKPQAREFFSQEREKLLKQLEAMNVRKRRGEY